MKIESTTNTTNRKYEKEIRTAVSQYLRKRGLANSEIASVLGVSYQTVYSYIGKQPYLKFGGVMRDPDAIADEICEKLSRGIKERESRKAKTKKRTTSNVTPLPDLTLEKKLEILTEQVYELTNAIAMLVDHEQVV